MLIVGGPAFPAASHATAASPNVMVLPDDDWRVPWAGFFLLLEGCATGSALLLWKYAACNICGSELPMYGLVLILDLCRPAQAGWDQQEIRQGDEVDAEADSSQDLRASSSSGVETGPDGLDPADSWRLGSEPGSAQEVEAARPQPTQCYSPGTPSRLAWE